MPVHNSTLTKRSLTDSERDDQIRRCWEPRGFEVKRKPRKPGVRAVLSDEERERRRIQYQRRAEAIKAQAAIRADYLIRAWLNQRPRKWGD